MLTLFRNKMRVAFSDGTDDYYASVSYTHLDVYKRQPHYGTLWAISENPLHKTIFHRILIRVPLFTAGVLISFLLLNWLRGRSTDSGAGLPKRAL